MPKSTFTTAYRELRRLLVQARQEIGATQGQVAACLGRPQSFVSKYESGDRRLDVVELLQVADCLKFSRTRLLSQLISATPASPTLAQGDAKNELVAIHRDMELQLGRAATLTLAIQAAGPPIALRRVSQDRSLSFALK